MGVRTFIDRRLNPCGEDVDVKELGEVTLRDRKDLLVKSFGES